LGTAIEEFHLYEFTLEYDPRPEQVNYLHIPNINLGTFARKRFTNFAFVIDTLGGDVTFTPYVDNVAKTASTVNRAQKLTHIHYFTSETLGTDIGGILVSPSGNPFEYYGPNLEEIVSEKLPTPVKFLVIPASDYGSPNRKRHTSYKFQIITSGGNVLFTPIVDGVSYATSVANTSTKRTHEHFFDPSLDIVGIDIGGTLESTDDTEFEYYGVIVPQQIELLPPRLKSLYINTNNFGVSAKKRLRTLPLVIDTGAQRVAFTPIVDNNPYPTVNFTSIRKTTLNYYFTSDVFGTDFGGILESLDDTAFEFYGFGNPENVETLPVAKKYDQLSPLRFDKIGKLFGFRVRLIIAGTDTVSMPFKIESEAHNVWPTYGTELYSGSFPVVPGVDDVYEVQLPKNVNGTMFRIVLGPTDDPFHRYDLLAKVSLSGMESDSKWMPTR
jgi:hypothetical protein